MLSAETVAVANNAVVSGNASSRSSRRRQCNISWHRVVDIAVSVDNALYEYDIVPATPLPHGLGRVRKLWETYRTTTGVVQLFRPGTLHNMKIIISGATGIYILT